MLALLLLAACARSPEGCEDRAALDTATPVDRTVSGLDARPAQRGCVAPAPLPSSSTIPLAFEEMFPGLPMGNTTMLVQHPTEADAYFAIRQGYPWMTGAGSALSVIRRSGRVWSNQVVYGFDAFTEYTPEGASDPVMVWEGGVLGLALHPDFASGARHAFVYFTRPYGGDEPGVRFESAVVRLTLDAEDRYVEGSVRDVLVQPQPADHHNGGHLMFGRDGFLYVAFGDGGVSDGLTAQDPSNLLGSIARIDVDGGEPYAVPSDNPFVGNTRGWREEIYAYGLRNPWKLDQSPLDGAVWVADVGEADWEELNVLEPGRNYGWPHMRGHDCALDACDPAVYTPPMLAMPHQALGGDMKALIGGAFYANEAVPEWAGRYFFANMKDTSQIYTVEHDLDGVPRALMVEEGTFEAILGLIRLRDGRVVVLAHNGPWALQAGQAAPRSDFPERLSETGCFGGRDLAPVDAMIPFDVRAPLWSDGADKRRWMVVPDGQALTVTESGDIEFPAGSLLFKEFAFGCDKLETRMLVHHDDGTWRGYTYKWNDAQDDAVLLRGGLVEDVAGVSWQYPSGAQCASCHQASAGRALGPDLRQLVGAVTYPSGIRADQLATLSHIGLLPGHVRPSRGFPRLGDEAAPPSARARAYLHANCAHCHNPGGTDRTSFDLRAEVPFADMNVCDVAPRLDPLGIPDLVLVAPMHPERSMLFARTASEEPSVRMPQLGTSLADHDWLDVATAWIQDMPDCRGADADGDGIPDESDDCPLVAGACP